MQNSQNGDVSVSCQPKDPEELRNKWNIKVQYFYSCLMNLSCSSILEKNTEKYIFIKH